MCQLGSARESVVRGLTANRSLTRLDFFGTYIGNDGAEGILEIMKSRPTLTWVRLGSRYRYVRAPNGT